MARKSKVRYDRQRISLAYRTAFSTASKEYGRPDLQLKDDESLRALRRVVTSTSK